MGQSIHIHLDKAQDEARESAVIPADAYADFAEPAAPAWARQHAVGIEKAEFVVATDSDGAILRVVSQHATERHIVGALVGSWVARGYRVQYLEGAAALMKALRKSQKVTEVQAPQKPAEPAAPAAASDGSLDAFPPGDSSPVGAGTEPPRGVFDSIFDGAKSAE